LPVEDGTGPDPRIPETEKTTARVPPVCGGQQYGGTAAGVKPMATLCWPPKNQVNEKAEGSKLFLSFIVRQTQTVYKEAQDE